MPLDEAPELDDDTPAEEPDVESPSEVVLDPGPPVDVEEPPSTT